MCILILHFLNMKTNEKRKKGPRKKGAHSFWKRGKRGPVFLFLTKINTVIKFNPKFNYKTQLFVVKLITQTQLIPLLDFLFVDCN